MSEMKHGDVDLNAPMDAPIKHREAKEQAEFEAGTAAMRSPEFQKAMEPIARKAMQEIPSELKSELDAARAELKEAVGFLKELMPTNIELICGECGCGEETKCRRLHPDCVFPRIRAFLARVGKQP